MLEAAHRFGTPAYVTDVATLTRAAGEITDAFPDPWLRQYSLKANDVPGIVRHIGTLGFGANVVSGGEWSLAVEAGIPNGQITLEGVGKSDADLRRAVGAVVAGEPLRWVAIESAEEAAVLASLTTESGLGTLGRAARLDVLLRLNPGVEPETSQALAVGSGSSKFGLRETELEAAIGAGGGPRSPIRWRGIHLHIGSQLQGLEAWRAGIRQALAVFAVWRRTLPDFDALDLGGGFPVASGDQPVPAPADFARVARAALHEVAPGDRPSTLAVEPGRFLVARAGWIISRVLHRRAGRGPAGQPMVVIDAGMTELVRPALYGAHHEIVALTSKGSPIPPGDVHDGMLTLVEGPICESTDRLGQHLLPQLERGDLVAIANAGAYGSSMSSRYNGRPRPPEVLLEADGNLRLVR